MQFRSTIHFDEIRDSQLKIYWLVDLGALTRGVESCGVYKFTCGLHKNVLHLKVLGHHVIVPLVNWAYN